MKKLGGRKWPYGRPVFGDPEQIKHLDACNKEIELKKKIEKAPRKKMVLDPVELVVASCPHCFSEGEPDDDWYAPRYIADNIEGNLWRCRSCDGIITK